MKKVEVEESSETPVDLQDDINEYEQLAQDISFSSMESAHSNILSEISIMSYEEDLKAAEESEKSDESERSSEFEGESEIFEESNADFPNDAYKDLMVLVTKHKLNNKAGNAIIKFFNKHSALSKSPLPKNIEKGRTFMNNMKFPNLTFNKICIAHYNSKQYFLHYQDLIQCVKNILAIPDITQNFVLSYENYKRRGENVYKEQNNGI